MTETKPTTKGRAPTGRRSKARSKARRQVFGELVQVATEQGAPIQLGTTTSEAMQMCLDRAVSLWYFAASKVDELKFSSDDHEELFETELGPGGAVKVIPNRWYTMEREARQDIEKLAGLMAQLGIADRAVRVEEAKAALLVAAVREAAIDAGLDNEQVRALGAALRAKVEASVAALPTQAPSSFSQSQDPVISKQVAEAGR